MKNQAKKKEQKHRTSVFALKPTTFFFFLIGKLHIHVVVFEPTT